MDNLMNKLQIYLEVPGISYKIVDEVFLTIINTEAKEYKAIITVEKEKYLIIELGLTRMSKNNEKPFFIMKEHNEITDHFICQPISSTKIKKNTNEVLEAKWFTEKEIIEGNLDKEVKKVSLIAFKKRKTPLK